MYIFHPGQKLICHRQKRPAKDLGFVSYLALRVHSAHLIWDSMFRFVECLFLNKIIPFN